jgi:hypothetical protein
MSGQWSHGKGDIQRPSSIGREELRLREALAHSLITFEQFEQKYQVLLREGKITRDGRKLCGMTYSTSSLTRPNRSGGR